MKNWVCAAALVAAVFLAYQPAWHGGFIWDDDGHLTRPDLRSWHGLYRIWFDLGATQQYYPLLHSAFWLEHKLWGDSPTGYHLVNIALHITAALMVAVLLQRLAIPGAWLAAAIFALHPVNVESVAWITELKNTLSAVFYLGSAIAYLRFDETRKASWYLTAIGLFMFGLLSKTVVATMPGALLLVFWWKRGRLSWQRDVRPLLPFFLIGAGAGIFTAWVERTLIGAHGAQFDFSIVERCLIAGRAIWFYLGKLVWPAHLVFIYPRWQINETVWWQYLFPAAALLLLAALWLLRRRSRSPLAAMLFFVGTLFPVLGFFNVYPFIFSFVADHFQYLASLGMIALFAAGAALLLRRADGPWRVTGQAACVALVAVLAVLTWRQSRMYSAIDSLYRTTIEQNPNCWLAHINLGKALAGRGQLAPAIAHFRKALQIFPDNVEAHTNLGNSLAGIHETDEAISHYQKALKIKPGYADANYNLGNVLLGRGLLDEAIGHYRKAVEIKPDYIEAYTNLGIALAKRGQMDEAIAQYRKALEIAPDFAEAHLNLGSALADSRRFDEALEQYQKALALALARNDPDLADAIRERTSRLRRSAAAAGNTP